MPMRVPSMKYVDSMPKEDRKMYAGHWIVVVNDKVVCHSKKEADTHEIVDMHDENGDMPVVQYIPEKDTPFLLHGGRT